MAASKGAPAAMPPAETASADMAVDYFRSPLHAAVCRCLLVFDVAYVCLGHGRMSGTGLGEKEIQKASKI